MPFDSCQAGWIDADGDLPIAVSRPSGPFIKFAREFEFSSLRHAKVLI